MRRDQTVAIFWDFETAQIKSRASGYKVTKALRDIAHTYGVVQSFRTYLDVASQSEPSDFLALRREIHCSGVSIVDCPSVSRKDVADKAMIVDMLTMAMDASGATILIATGDRDLSYALAVLRFRGFKIILVCPPKTDESLLMQADDTFNWNSRVLGIDDDLLDSSSSLSSSSASSASSKHTLSSYRSYPAPLLSYDHTNDYTGGSNQARGRVSQVPSTQPPLSRPPPRSVHGIRRVDGNDAAPELEKVTDRVGTFPAVSSPALSPVPSMNDISPIHQVSNTPKSTQITGSVPALASPFRAASVPQSRPRTRSNTISGEWFFPPAPSFPLESPLPPTTSAKDKPAATGGPSPSSSESYTIVDRPKSTTGSHPPLTSSTPPPAPALSSPKNSRVPAPGGSGPLSTPPVQAPQIAAPSHTLGDHHNVTPNGTTGPPCPTPTPATEKLPATPVIPASVQKSSAIPQDKATTSTNHTAPKFVPVTPTAKPAPLAAASVTTRPSQTKPPSSSTAQTNVAVRPPIAIPKIYHTLVQRLQHNRQKGVTWPTGSHIASELLKRNASVYKSAGVKKWSQYAHKAESDGIITIVGDTISLKQEYRNSVIP